MKFTHFFLLILFPLLMKGSNNYFNIKDFSAIGDGISLETDAINLAIEKASAQGGGTVYFPPGKYLSFSIRLKSNIRIYLETGATLIAASPKEHEGFGYDIPDYNIWGDSLKYQDFGHSHWKNSLIWGIDLENIVIEGYGLIYGKGLERWGFRKPGLGNKTIALKNCKNVVIKNISILQGGHFGILPTGVENFTIDNVKIDSNRDGINIDCCKNVTITNCFVNTPNDDAIVLKSSYALGYPKPTEFVTISNCHVSGFDMGTMLDGTFKKTQEYAPDKGGVTGRIKLGTESNSGFKNITITNCVFEHCRGLAIETVDGAIIEDIVISNISMHDIVNSPFYLRLGARMRGPEELIVGKLHRINISNIVVTGTPSKYAALILGIEDHYINDVDFNNIKVLVDGGADAEQASIIVPEDDKQYPDPRLHGKIPAYGFYVRHAEGIEFNNIEIAFKNPDERPAFYFEDTKNIKLNNVEVDKTTESSSYIKLIDCENIRLKEFEGLKNKHIKSTESEIL